MEQLIVVAILALLGAIVVAQFTNAVDTSRVDAMSATVQKVRERIAYEAASGSGGFPPQVDPAWFPQNEMPTHLYAADELIVETVAAGPAVVYPAVKTFDATVPGVDNAWYNSDNGVFCARVIDEGDPVLTLATFNDVNLTDATGLGQTTR